MDSILPIVGVELDNDATLASFTAEVLTLFLLYHRQKEFLLDNPIWLTVSR